MSKALILSECVLVLICWFALATAVSAAGPGLEYRFKTQDGIQFKWRDGKSETLERQPFMVATDFDNAIAIRSTNPKLPGAFEIDLVHNKAGKQKYRDTRKAARSEEYCVVFNEIILQCYALPPKIAALYEHGGSIYGPFWKVEADDLTRQINRTLH
jgi:hypothetical protein